jgi:hypothetical protein
MLEMIEWAEESWKELKTDQEVQPIEGHPLIGQVYETTKWYGKIIKEKLGIGVIFRNIRVLNIYKETDRAILVDAELFGGIGRCCGVCGRYLDNEISRATGIGPVCASKMGLPRPTMENAKEIVKLLEAKSKEAGLIEKVWIPKSQIEKINKMA